MTQKPVRPRKMPTQQRSMATVDAIMTALAQVLARDGWDAANTNRIAEVAGVSVGSLYQYFPNKEAIVLSLIEQYSSRLLEQLQVHAAQMATGTVEENIRRYVNAMLVLPRQNPELHRAFVVVVLQAGHEHIRDLENGLIQIVRAYLEVHKDGILPRNLDMAAFVLVTTVEGVTNLALLKHPNYVLTSEFENELSDIILRYLVGGSR